MRRWAGVIAVVGFMLLAGSWAALRHAGMFVRAGQEVRKQAIESEDLSQSVQLGVELLAEGRIVTAAAQVQLGLRGDRPLAAGPLLRGEAFLGPQGNQRATWAVQLLGVEGSTYTLESKATCEVVDLMTGARKTYSKTSTVSVEVSADSIGDLNKR